MVTTLPDGSSRFRVYLPHAATVELLGSFTDWRDRPVRMTRHHPGWWEVDVAVPPGEHQFSYLVDGSVWIADYAAHGVKLNSYGGWTSCLSVRADAAVPAAA